MKTKTVRLLFGMLIALIATAFQVHAQVEKKAEKDSLEETKAVFFIIENMPEYPGGEIGLKTDIDSLIHYPQEAIDKGITGRVLISFVIDKEGKIKNARITSGIGEELDQEALRVINALKPWQPAMQSGETIEVNYIVQFDFLAGNKIECKCVNF